MKVDELRTKASVLAHSHPLELFRKVLIRASRGCVDVNCLNALEYQPDSEVKRCDSPVVLREATLSDIEGLAKCQGTPIEVFLKRFAAKDHCVVALIDDKVAGYEWFCHRSFCVEDRYLYKLDLPSDALYAYDACVMPQHRRAAIWKQFHIRYLRGLMSQLGRRRVVAMVDSGNRLSMKVHLRLGYRLFRKIFTAKVLGKSFFLTWSIAEKKRSERPPSSVPSLSTGIDARGEQSFQP